MDLSELIELMKAWSAMGWAVQEQLTDSLDDMSVLPEQNQNALRIAADFLDKCARAGVEDAAQYASEIRAFVDAPEMEDA